MSDIKHEIERQIAAIDAMTQTEGWQMLARSLEDSERAAYSSMLSQPSSETAKHFGAYNAIKDIRSWPQRARQVLVHRLRTENPGVQSYPHVKR